jgi:flavin reductase (DIM6/NTAB) family NADH-FMN oxidoreductase RutF
VSATAEQFREAWRKFPTGVTIVTTRQDDGTPYFTTANAVASVSLDPLLVSLSVTKDGATCANIMRDDRFGINMLREGRADVASFFATASREERRSFPSGHSLSPSGIAILDEALSGMDCRVMHSIEAGDHVVFIGEVEHIEVREGAPLVFYGGRYTTILAADGEGK